MGERESWKLHVFEIQMCSEALYPPYLSKALSRLMCQYVRQTLTLTELIQTLAHCSLATVQVCMQQLMYHSH